MAAERALEAQRAQECGLRHAAEEADGARAALQAHAAHLTRRLEDALRSAAPGAGQDGGCAAAVADVARQRDLALAAAEEAEMRASALAVRSVCSGLCCPHAACMRRKPSAQLLAWSDNATNDYQGMSLRASAGGTRRA